MPSCHTIAQLLALVILSCSLFTAHAALTLSEQAALRQILENHPALSSVAAWETLDVYGVYHGRSWNNSFDTLCQNDGYDFYGVYCVGGHVGGLRVTSSWGISFNDDYSALSGLTYLTNYTEEFALMSPNVGILGVLSASLPLTHVDLLSSALFPNFTYPETLVYLSGRIPGNYSFENMLNLQTLKISNLGSVVDFSPFCGSSLQEISIIYGGNLSQFIDLVNCAPSLQRASFTTYSMPRTDTLDDIISPSLTYLWLDVFSSYPIPGFNIECNALETLQLNVYYTSVNFTAPVLRTLSILGDLPPNFSSLVHLENFVWISSGIIKMPSLLFAPNLTVVSLGLISFAAPNVNEMWGAFPTTLTQLYLSNFVYNGQISFPSNWTSLKTLSMSFMRGGGINANSVLSLTSLQGLSAFQSGDVVASLDALYRLPNLTMLSYNGATLPMQFPSDFFVRMNKLVHLSLGNTRLTGAVPWRGLENLEGLYLDGALTTWPTIEGSASRLRALNIKSDSLIMLPTDEAFRAANLQNLRYLTIRSTSLKTMPIFWTNSPQIDTVTLNLGYLGPFQAEISAPRLSALFLGDNLCGSLPDIARTTHLSYLHLSMNYFTGTIPQSWEDNLNVIGSFDISYNSLSGTIPPKLFDHHGSLRPDVRLNSNNFTGPLWNMSAGMPERLVIDNTGLDICAQDPQIPNPNQTSICEFYNLPKCPSRCSSYWDKCGVVGTCTERPPILRPIVACPLPNVSCPLPQPGPGFECNHGVWIFVGTPTNVTLTLPPSAGPIYVFGNLSTNSTITFTGTGTFITVLECVVETPSQIIIELPSESTPPDMTLITQSGKNCRTDLGRIPVVLAPRNEDCMKTKVTSSSTLSSLAVVFSVDDTCPKSTSSKTKWIILGSAVGGVLVLILATITVLHLKSPVFRTCMRTCSIRKALSSR